MAGYFTDKGVNMNFSKISLAALSMNFMLFAAHGLAPKHAARVLYWLDKETTGDCSGGSAITQDGKYKNRNGTYECVKNIADGKEAAVETVQLKKDDAAALENIFGAAKSLAEDENTAVLDISYDRLKDYYDLKHKGEKVSFRFREDGKTSGEDSFLQEIKNFFDADNPPQDELKKLADKFFVISEENSPPKGFKTVMNSVLDIMIKMQTGSKRIKSLLLQVLLSHIDGEAFYKTAPLPAKMNIVFFEGMFGMGGESYVDPMMLRSLNGLFRIDGSGADNSVNFESMFSALEKALYSGETNQDAQKPEGKSFGNTDKDRTDLYRAYCFTAVAVIHELSHTYHERLPEFFQKHKVDSSVFKEACIKNAELGKQAIPLLDPVFSRQVKKAAETDPDIQKFLKNNAQWAEKNLETVKKLTGEQIDALDMLIDRDIARALNVLDAAEETMTVNGSFFFHLGDGKFMQLKDAENEAAASRELKFSVRYGHAGMRLDDKKTDEEYKSENCCLNYEPFRLCYASLNRSERMFEPIILQRAVNKAQYLLSLQGN